MLTCTHVSVGSRGEAARTRSGDSKCCLTLLRVQQTHTFRAYIALHFAGFISSATCTHYQLFVWTGLSHITAQHGAAAWSTRTRSSYERAGALRRASAVHAATRAIPSTAPLVSSSPLTFRLCVPRPTVRVQPSMPSSGDAGRPLAAAGCTWSTLATLWNMCVRGLACCGRAAAG